MYRALEEAGKRQYPGSTVLPGMLNGYTDMALLRARGIQSYGFGSALTLNDRTNFGAHSDVERIPEASLHKAVQFLWDAVSSVAGHK